MKPALFLLAFVATLALAQQPPSDLDIRIGALSASYRGQIASAAEREATLTAELASMQAKLKAVQDTLEATKKLCAAACEPKKEEAKK